MELVYQSPRATLWTGAAEALLASLVDGVDVVITDPPYDKETHAGARGSSATYGALHRLALDWPEASPEAIGPAVVAAARRWAVVSCPLEHLGRYRAACGPAYVRGGFWRRIGDAPQFSGDRPAQPGEGVAILHRAGRKRWNGRGADAYFEALIVREAGRHVAQKPLALARQWVRLFSDPDEVILDPWMGSGALLVAAVLEGRRVIGGDLDPAWASRAAAWVREAETVARLPLEPASRVQQEALW